MHHAIHLHPHRFQKVSSGQKTIELRLYDEKRRGFFVGDTITFLERETENAYQTRIVSLHVYTTFHALLSNHSWDEM
jgi:ASC-1-like (ASCH) protein